MVDIRRMARAAAPNFGYGLTVFATLFLGNVGLILATTPHIESAAFGHLTHIVAFSIIAGLAGIFTGLNVNRSFPLADRSAVLWIWLLGLPTARRLAEIALAVRWDQEMAVEVGLLAVAAVIVLMGAGRLAPERLR